LDAAALPRFITVGSTDKAKSISDSVEVAPQEKRSEDCAVTSVWLKQALNAHQLLRARLQLRALRQLQNQRRRSSLRLSSFGCRRSAAIYYGGKYRQGEINI
jgi:hypothetical protein